MPATRPATIAGLRCRYYSSDEERRKIEREAMEEAAVGGLGDDFKFMCSIYDAIRATPEDRREDVLTFVLKRLEHERMQRKMADMEKYNKQLAGVGGGQLRGPFNAEKMVDNNNQARGPLA